MKLLPAGRHGSPLRTVRELDRGSASNSGQVKLGKTYSQFNVSFTLHKSWLVLKKSNNFLFLWCVDQSHDLPLPVTPPTKHHCWSAHFHNLSLNNQTTAPFNPDGTSKICDSFTTPSIRPSLSALLLICFTKSSPVRCSLSHASAKTNQMWPTKHYPPSPFPLISLSLSLLVGLTCKAPIHMSSCASLVRVAAAWQRKIMKYAW